MSKEEALAIVSDQKFKDAFLEYRKAPMKTDDNTFRMARDFCDAILMLDS